MHNSLGIETLIDQVLMVSENFNIRSEEYVPVFLEGFYSTEKFSLSRSVVRLHWIQLAAVESYWLSIL